METAPVLWRGTVLPAWTDYNEHLNDGYYAVAFSLASEAFLEQVGLYTEYRAATGCTVYTVETHISYLKELKAAAPLAVSCQLIAFDAKRVHIYMEMLHAEAGFVAASYETLFLHIDQKTVRVVAMPSEVITRLESVKKEQADLPLPARVGRNIRLRV